MKKLILTLFTTIILSTVNSQTTYECVKHFDGTVLKDSISWNPTENITNTKLTINKSTILIENNKYEFKLITLISNTNNELIYYSTDWEDLHCYVIIEDYISYKYVYFQYENLIYGYKIIKI